MAKDPKLSLRTAINDAYAFVQSQQFNEGMSSISFDILLQMELDRYEGNEVTGRASKLAQLDALKERVHKAIDDAKNINPDEFELINEEEEVNTEE